MRIKSLLIHNFRAIQKLELSDLGNTIVIAGSNGCGKTQIFNAIRLFKSTYGGYQPNEYQQWWGEFQINLNKPGKEIYRIFRDKSKPIIINAKFELASSEKEYLSLKAEKLIRMRTWEQFVPGLQDTGGTKGAAFAQAQRTHGLEVEKRTQSELELFTKHLESDDINGELTVYPSLEYETKQNLALELIFSTYEPEHLGIIDYHGAQRTYNREQIGGINLNIKQSADRVRQHSLYNYANKFSNIKSELAAGYIRDLIASEAGVLEKPTTSLTKTLQELFATFFPGKTFPGPTPGPDGTLDFPVKIENSEHDIDDLSSGEKEVLFGYLRLRNNAPRNSVMLIDEPELHLNPALLQGLPQFYHKYIGIELGNQLWLVTHSDTLLREAVGQPGFSVFHMQQAVALKKAENQVKLIHVGEPLDRAVVDLVGDLATYQPGGKVVIFEGGGDVDFDVRMTKQLFPKLHTEATLISAGDKGKVQNLHNLLSKASNSGALKSRFFSIVDRDSGAIKREVDAFSWDRYHIENYLLDPKYILEVTQALNIKEADLQSISGIKKKLIECAKETLNDLVRHELESVANTTLVSSIKTSVPHDVEKIAPSLFAAIQESERRIKQALSDKLTIDILEKNELIIRNRYSQHLKSDEWLSTYRGRDILKKFVDKYVGIVKYDVFRDLILARMRDNNHQPEGMRNVISNILKTKIKDA